MYLQYKLHKVDSPFNASVPLHAAVDTLEFIIESELEGDRLLGELHPCTVRCEAVQGTVASGEDVTSACEQQRRLQPHLAIASW